MRRGTYLILDMLSIFGGLPDFRRSRCFVYLAFIDSYFLSTLALMASLSSEYIRRVISRRLFSFGPLLVMCSFLIASSAACLIFLS